MKIKNILMLASAVATMAMSNSASAASTSAAFTGSFSTPNMDPNWKAGKATGTATAPCNGSVSAFVPSSLPYTFAPSIAGYSGNLAADPQQPLVAHNYGSNFNNGQFSILANETMMHPGPANECAILRYTVPAGSGGVYSISGAYQRADSNAAALGDGVKGMILKNGTAVGNIVDTGQGTGSGTAVAQQVTLCPGDSVDFAVHMKSKYFYDTTQLVGRLAKVGDTNSCSPPPPPEPLLSCCDPVLGTISWGTFPDDLNSTNPNFTNSYGFLFQPTAAFHAAMDQTADIARIMVAAMNGNVTPPWAVVTMEGEMRSHNGVPSHSPILSATPGPDDAEHVFDTALPGSGNTGHPHPRVNGTSLSQTLMAAWVTPGTGQYPAGSGTSNAFSLSNTSTWTNPGMKADGTIYALKPTFWIYYPNQQGQLVKRPLFCRDLKDRYKGFQKVGTAAFKMNQNDIGFALGGRSSSDMRSSAKLGAPVLVTADEAKRIEEIRSGRGDRLK